MAWTNIAEYVLDQVFGFQDANELRANDIALKDVPYVVTSAAAPSNFLPNVQALNTLASGYVKNTIGTGVLTTVTTIPGTDITGTITPGAHKTSHENGGADEITVAGLSGLLADGQTPLAHASVHNNGGADEINVAGLSGLLADGQTPLAHKTSHENGGTDEISVAGLSGLLADGQTPLTHATSHQNGGGDEISVTGLSGLLADGQTPLAHATSHDTGGSDAITALAGSVITTGTVAMARLPTPVQTQTLIFDIASFASPGSAIATGVAGVIVVPWACTITQIMLLSADASATSGSIVVDIWKDSYANYPPTVADTIFGTKPSLSSAIKSLQTGLSIALAADDVLVINVDSVSSVTRVLLELRVLLT